MKGHAAAIITGVITALVVSVVTWVVVSLNQGSAAISELRIRELANEEIAEAKVDELGDQVNELAQQAAADGARDDAQQRSIERIDRFIEDL